MAATENEQRAEAGRSVNASLKASIKAVLRPPLLAGWPAVEYAARLLPSYSDPKLKFHWSSEWTEEFDDALNLLPTLSGVPRDHYRELVRPTGVPKLHALAMENGEPTAMISLRRRLRFWEPVTYQCIPKVVLPAVNAAALGRALNGLGIEVLVGAGICDELPELNARNSWSYEWYGVHLQEDYEAHWRKKKRMYSMNRARSRCADFEFRVDGEGDLEWIVRQWQEQWRADHEQEIVATEDRLRLWSALMAAPEQSELKVHTAMFRQGEQRVSGLVFTEHGDGVMMQCGGRDPNFDDSYTAAAATLCVIDWAKERGFKLLDLAGGAWKRHWGPAGGVRHGACFRSRLIDRLNWVN